MKKLLYCLACLVLTINGIFAQQENNPPAPGFNAEASDPQAIRIADEVMQAMGGRKNWDDTRYIVWNFFGRRKLFWDKYSGNVRIEMGNAVYLVNIHNNTGKVRIGEEIVTHPDSLREHVNRGISAWINDGYWLFMPFKLKDSGVTLRYLGVQTTADGRPADVLQLTFEKVGRTPDNKYHVFVDKETRLVTQWEYFTKYTDEKPAIANPWSDYRRYGKILLSGNRGPNRQLTEIGVYAALPAEVFESFAPVDYAKFIE